MVIDPHNPARTSAAKGTDKHRLAVRRRALAALILGIVALAPPIQTPARGASASAIDRRADAVLKQLYGEVHGAGALVKNARGVLIFPDVYRAGFGVGGEYGNGTLRIRGRSVQYYNIVGVSFGLQFGAERRAVVLVFLDKDALEDFRCSDGWKVGVDGSVVLAKIGADASVDSTTVKAPVVGFVFGAAGLMYNLTLEGAKINKVHLHDK